MPHGTISKTEALADLSVSRRYPRYPSIPSRRNVFLDTPADGRHYIPHHSIAAFSSHNDILRLDWCSRLWIRAKKHCCANAIGKIPVKPVGIFLSDGIAPIIYLLPQPD